MLKFKTLVSACAAVLLTAGAVNADEIAKYNVVDMAIPKSLTGKAGDPVNGEKVFINRKLGNCLACHEVTALKAQPFHGLIGPSLDGVGERYDEGQLRLQVVNAKAINPDTIMPAFHRTEGFHRVLKKFEGKPVISAQQVEDVVAYLKTLK